MCDDGSFRQGTIALLGFTEKAVMGLLPKASAKAVVGL